MGMHKLSVDDFVVFYTVDSGTKTVTVVRIVHGGRDIESITTQNHEKRSCAIIWMIRLNEARDD